MQGRQQRHVATRSAKAAFQADLDALLRPKPRASVKRVKLVGFKQFCPSLLMIYPAGRPADVASPSCHAEIAKRVNKAAVMVDQMVRDVARELYVYDAVTEVTGKHRCTLRIICSAVCQLIWLIKH